MEVRWHLKPDDVSFYHVETQEQDCPATNVSGCYRDANRQHEVADWTSYEQNNDDSTPHGDSVGDRRGATETGPPPKWHNASGSQYEAGGEYTWDIPWKWRVIAIGNIKGSGKNPHHVTVTESGSMTVTKFGKSTTGGPHTQP